MEAPLVEGDATAAFFLKDTARRLTRLVELAFCYGVFFCFLYCRMLAPGGYELWSWAESPVAWLIVFAPLFALDWKALLHWRYLRANRDRFAAQDGSRHILMCIAEFLYKFCLCLHLSCRPLRSFITIKAAMFVYAVGYMMHFVLGHFVPLEEGDRAEGCNVVATLVGDLARFLSFVLVVSLSLKVEDVSQIGYDWEAAFWPCWGLEGIIMLVVVMIFPICIISLLVDRAKTLMLVWVIVFGIGLGVASFLSMYNVAHLLDQGLCPASFGDAAKAPESFSACRRRLEGALWPWFILLPSFACITLLLRRPLAVGLHEAWYQPERSSDEAAARGATNVYAHHEELPPPTVMFRVTATYYSRECDADALGGYSVSLLPAGAQGPSDHLSTASVHSGSWLPRAGRTVDPSASILSARGGAFEDIVESEQLCFVCYDKPPDAALLECGHAGLCETCARHLLDRRPAQAHCPICRSVISAVVRLRTDLPVPPALFLQPSPLQRLASGDVEDLSGVPWAVGPSGDGGAGADLESPTSVSASGFRLPPAVPGPPWPAAAKQHAVVVEVAQRAGRLGGRSWLPGR